MNLETFLTYVWTDGNELDGSMELAGRWKAAGLDDREIAVLLCHQAGMTLQEMGDAMKLARSTVSRIRRRAEEKLRRLET